MTDQSKSAAVPDLLLERIAAAAEGLFIMSETDAPLIPFRWASFFSDKDTVAALHRHRELPPDAPVETVTLERFFKAQTEPQEGDDDEILEEKSRLTELRDLLAKDLQDPAVYRVGTINITAYILGKVPGTDDAAGVSAELVET